MMQRFPKIPTPLEIADAGLDTVAEVAALPARLLNNLAGTVQQTAQGIEAGINRPKNAGGVPASPDQIIGGALDVANAVLGGAVSGINGVLKAVQDTGQGVKGQIDTLVR